jgi:hypothetical protein
VGEVKGVAVCLMMRKAGEIFVIKSFKASAFLSGQPKTKEKKKKKKRPFPPIRPIICRFVYRQGHTMSVLLLSQFLRQEKNCS